MNVSTCFPFKLPLITSKTPNIKKIPAMNIPKLPDPVKYVMNKKESDLTDDEFRDIYKFKCKMKTLVWWKYCNIYR